MASIASIVKAGKGTAGAWRIVRDGDDATLYHYSTAMLGWNVVTGECHTYRVGWGSVSDQGGMNKAFRAIGCDLYYSRAGGARIEGRPYRVAA